MTPCPGPWGTLRPLYADGSVINEATALHKALALPPMTAIPAEVFTAFGLRPYDMAAIRGVLAAYDHTNVVWVAAGGGWAADSVSCPRSGEVIVRDQGHWYSTGADFKRPSPQWWFDDDMLYGPDGLALPMRLALPGTVNRGNAAQAVAAAVALGADPAAAVTAVSGVDEVAGRYRTIRVGAHTVRMLLAKNPAGWQEALSMVDKDAAGVVISVNGQVPDGEDLSWLWDVRFEHFERAFKAAPVVAAGERGTDLAVRLGYAGVQHTLVHDTLAAIESCPPGPVEVVANYTAFLQLQRRLARHG